MKIEYEYTFGLPRKIVWQYIKDAGILKNSLTNCSEFEETSRGVYQAKSELKIGPIQDIFALDIQRVQEKSHSYYQLFVKGKGKLGQMDGKADLHIKEFQGGSRLILQAEAELSGALAVAGQKIIESGAKKSLENFFQRAEKEIKRSLYLQKRGR